MIHSFIHLFEYDTYRMPELRLDESELFFALLQKTLYSSPSDSNAAPQSPRSNSLQERYIYISIAHFLATIISTKEKQLISSMI